MRFHSKRRRLARRANPTSVSYFPPSRFPSLPFRLRGDPLYKRSICGATRTTNIMPHSSVDPLKDDRRQCLIRGSEAAILHLFQLYGDGAPSTDDQSAQFPALPLVCLSANLADAPAIATKPSPCAHHLSGPPVNSEVICAVGKRYWVPEFCWGSSTGQGGLTPDDGNTTKGVHADYDIDHDTFFSGSAFRQLAHSFSASASPLHGPPDEGGC